MAETSPAPAPRTDGNASSGIALFDERPFFEKALAYGVAHGLIGAERLVRSVRRRQTEKLKRSL